MTIKKDNNIGNYNDNHNDINGNIYVSDNDNDEMAIRTLYKFTVGFSQKRLLILNKNMDRGEKVSLRTNI